MLKRDTDKKLENLTKEEEFFLKIPDCRCSACIQLYDVIKNKTDEKRFKKLDYNRLYKIYFGKN